MLAPIRTSVSRTVARSSSSSVGRLSAGIGARRTLVTKEERWDLNTIKQANEQNLIPDESGKGGSDLTSSIPSLEARWAQLSKEEQYGIFRHLEELQRKDWKELSVDQKKAAYFISFGPHGPRKAITQPGQAMRTMVGVSAIVGATVAVFFGIRHFAAPPPKTMTKEYQDAMTEKAREEKLNPISGISSEGYKGKGYEQKSLA
ncbi:cytochrome c oxidase subunit IV [Meira miltonrushii]|uniref:Cytochrome c oxidase subunit IV n=1 Tax=Meira miltonrushii TaxID=1280837 RepID=A0A316VDD0_9BASI|nr:cytochrome c oxidase subunit IV [Meira miltonrushii]PWN35098.1 cytochrome c oxidase subunit IV [Meira miltonrushii]